MIEIEVYKGQAIEYDEDKDKFICDITIEDKYKSTARKSLKDVRKEIDAFIKANLEFKPFKVIVVDDYSSGRFHERTFEAIRTDGLFVVSGGWSNSHWGAKEMERCMVHDPELIKEKERLEKEIKDFTEKKNNEIKALSKKLVKMDFSKYDKFISQAASV